MKAGDVSQATASLPRTPDAAPPASWVEKSPRVCGGEVRIRKLRSTAWGLLERRNSELSDAEILQHLPELTHEDLDAAWSYYEQHREEIDQAIRDNVEA